MDIESIKAKYLANDDALSKMQNRWNHERASAGIKVSRNTKAAANLEDYISNANEKLGGFSGPVQIVNKSNGRGLASFGLNWKTLGTVGVPEAQLFVKKLQQAIKLVQNAPKVPTKPIGY